MYMAEVNKNNTYITSDYANWLPFLTNTQNELNEIERLGASAFLDLSLLNTFYARFRTFMSTRWSYVRNHDELKEKLKKIGKVLFSQAYVYDLDKFQKTKNINPQFVAMHNKLLENILEILEVCCNEFAAHKLLYETKIKKSRDPSKAILEGYH